MINFAGRRLEIEQVTIAVQKLGLKFVVITSPARDDLDDGGALQFYKVTKNILENSLKKLQKKNCDWIIANDVSDKSIGFNSENNEVTIIYKDQKTEKISKVSKSEIAAEIVSRVINNIKVNHAKNFN